MEAVFILTYIGIIVAVAALSCLIYWLWEGRKKPLSWKRLRAEVAMTVHILLQVALLWFAALGMAGAILVVYRVFVQPAELGILAVALAYGAGVGCTIWMWAAIEGGMKNAQ